MLGPPSLISLTCVSCWPMPLLHPPTYTPALITSQLNVLSTSGCPSSACLTSRVQPLTSSFHQCCGWPELTLLSPCCRVSVPSSAHTPDCDSHGGRGGTNMMEVQQQQEVQHNLLIALHTTLLSAEFMPSIARNCISWSKARIFGNALVKWRQILQSWMSTVFFGL